MKIRVGLGYDVHQLVEGRELWLGGIKIDHTLGLLGHSDADVLLHAIIESIIGALGLGDIGKHFPDTDPRYKGISSILLLKKVVELVKNKGYEISNLDSIVVAQNPKLKPYIEEIKNNLSSALGIEKDRISVKATTEEWLGFTEEKKE